MQRGSKPFAPAIPGILLMVVMVFYALVGRLIFSPLLVPIARDLNLSLSGASSFFFYGSLGFAVSLLFSGFLSHRISHKWCIVVSVSVCGVALILAARMNSIAWIWVFLIIMGAGGGLYPGSGIATVTTIVPDEHRGKAIALHETGPNLAFIFAPIIATLLLPLGNWRTVLTILGISALAFTAVFVIFFRGGNVKGQAPRLGLIRVYMRSKTFWILTLYLVIAASSAIGVFSVLPSFLITERGMEESFVNNLVGVSRIWGLVAVFLSGVLADRLGIPKVIFTIFVLTGTVTMAIGLLKGTLLVFAVFLQPLLVSAFFPAVFTALTDIGPPETRNLGISLAIPLAILIGGGVTPTIFGLLADNGVFYLGFVILGVMLLASLVLLPVLKRSGPEKLEEAGQSS